jgi:uncharacterized protein
MRNLFIGLLFLMACNRSPNRITPSQHAKEVAEWQQDRVESLLSEEGWLNLIGLFWLQEGSNTFGSGDAEDLKIEFSMAPQSMGSFELQDNQVYFIPLIRGILADGKEVTEKIKIFDAKKEESLKLAYGNLRWNIIKRADAFGVRLRDLEAASLREFESIPQFPVSLEWRIHARFVPQDPPREIMITNVLGQTTPNSSPGYIEFEKNGQEYKIQAIGEGNQLFLILADQTSGAETYGGGRYLYVTKPVDGDEVVLDFNKAYNPPCVFSPYATCPLPPRENILDLKILAGEKTFGDH